MGRGPDWFSGARVPQVLNTAHANMNPSIGVPLHRGCEVPLTRLQWGLASTELSPGAGLGWVGGGGGRRFLRSDRGWMTQNNRLPALPWQRLA